MRYALGAADGVGDGHRPPVMSSQQSEPLQAQAVHYGLQVEHPRVERVVGNVALRKAGPSAVVPDELPLLDQSLVPAASVRPLPLQLDVAELLWHVHEGLTLAHRPKGDAHTVARLGVLDARLPHAFSSSPR